MGQVLDKFNASPRYQKISLILIVLGAIAIAAAKFVYKGHDHGGDARFWSTLLYNAVFFLLITNASMFFICVTTMAMGGWQMAFRRIPEAISTVVKILAPITGVILLAILFMDNGKDIYHWLDPNLTDKSNHHFDKIINGKSGFLNKTFFIVFTALTLIGWVFLGMRMRKLSRESDDNTYDLESGKKYIYRNTVSASTYLVWFALTVASTVPWLWLMSIDAHWYSTMFSWYTFASSFVSGMALVAIYFIYLKSKGYLSYANEEHLHDIGKFMFAFSVFWTYLWFSQYMLIWYANIPEETVYFKQRVHGPYRGIFFFNLIINFIAPLLILMKRGAKRNYMLLAVMAFVIIFGHWLDFFQMVQPGVVNNVHHNGGHMTPSLNWFDFGTAFFFIGLIMWQTGKALAAAPLLAKNHPFTKESIIHHT
jgi:hypothetical protein